MTTIDLNHETISINPTDDLTLYDKNNIMSRIEKFLFAICSLDSSDLPVPLSRIEELYYCLVTGDTPPTFEPLSRAEKFLMACLGAYDINKLPEPLSRSEVLLKKIATGDSNLEDVDNLQSKYEFLLAYIIQNGGIGDFDEYDLNTQFSTLYNTKERPIKSAILKGNTLVNLFGNKSHDFSQGRTPSYKLTQSLKSNTIYTVIVNVTSLNATDVRCRFKNSDDKYLTYKTITEVGIHKFTMTPNTSLIYFCPFISSEDFDNGRYAIFDDLILLEGDYTNVDIPYFEGMASVKMPVLTTTGKNLFDINGELKTTFATYSINGDSLIVTGNWFAYQDVNLKPNTTYTLSCKSVKSESGYFKLGVYYNNISNAVVALKDTKELTFTTPSTFNDISVLFYAEEGNGTNTTTYTNIQLEEGSVATPYEPFKSNILTSGKTFTQSMFEQGSFKENTPFDTKPYDDIKINLSENSTYYSNRIRTITTHKVIPGASYKVKINDGYGIFLCFCKDGLYSKLFSESWTDTNIAVTVPTDCDEMFFALHKIDNSDITVEDYPAIGLEIRQEVTLRGIGDVKDEFNLLTGELTQRIGEIVLDGSEYWSLDTTKEVTQVFSYYSQVPIKDGYQVVCDKFPLNAIGDVEKISMSNNGTIYIAIDKTKADSVSKFKTWLKTTQVSIQTLLFQPTVKTVDLSVVNQDGNDTKLSTFNDITHVTLSSEGLIPEAELEVATKNEEDLEDSSVYTVHTLSEEFNTLYNTKEKPVKSAILTGQTLVNLVKGQPSYTFNAISKIEYISLAYKLPIGKYIILYDLTETGNNLRNTLRITYEDGTHIYQKASENFNTTIGRKYWIVETTQTTTQLAYWANNATQGTVISVENFMVIPYQEGMENWDIPYFTGMQSVKMPVLTTTGKNLFNPNAEFSMTGGTYGFIKLTNNKNNSISIVEKDSTVDMSDISFGLTENGINANEGYRWLYSNGKLAATEINNISHGYFSFFPRNETTLNKILQRFDIQFEESVTTTSYEPYRSNILTCNEEVVLRGGIGTTKDELNLLTGELTQRIGEIVVDGSESWSLTTEYPSDSAGSFEVYKGINNTWGNYNSNNMTINNIGLNSEHYLDVKQRRTSDFGIGMGHGKIIISVPFSKLSEPNTNGFKTWLASNPITIQYKLTTESVKTVDLSVVDQDGNDTKLSTFNDITHVTLSSEGLIPEAELEVAEKVPEIAASILTISREQEVIDSATNKQSENVDATMIATTEIYEGLL